MARFAIGDRVGISDREEARHHRVPAYVKGHEGEVERVCAAQGQPETLALGEDGEPNTHGARVVARAWVDPEYKTFLLKDGMSAVESLGLDPGYAVLTALENTPEVLREFGTEIPPGVEVRVHDSTAELRYIVIPMRPAGTEGMSESELASLVSRDSMIGTALAGRP